MSNQAVWMRALLSLGVGACLLLPCSPTRGQDRKALGKRIEALRVRMDEARYAADRADARRMDSLRAANQVELDTTMVGPLAVAHLRAQRGLAQGQRPAL